MRSQTFIGQNEGRELLALALTGQQFGARPSAMLGIEDASAALDFDLAAAIRLDRHDGLVRERESEFLALCIASATHTGKLPSQSRDVNVEYV